MNGNEYIELIRKLENLDENSLKSAFIEIKKIDLSQFNDDIMKKTVETFINRLLNSSFPDYKLLEILINSGLEINIKVTIEGRSVYFLEHIINLLEEDFFDAGEDPYVIYNYSDVLILLMKAYKGNYIDLSKYDNVELCLEMISDELENNDVDINRFFGENF
jgi:hypothetical protein